MARTENPFFAKSEVYSYCDDTEPKAYPHLFDEYVLKSSRDALESQISALKEEKDEYKKLATSSGAIAIELRQRLSEAEKALKHIKMVANKFDTGERQHKASDWEYVLGQTEAYLAGKKGAE